MANYFTLMNANGYYCNSCDTYHDSEEMKHRYIIETIGEWCGQPAEESHHEVYCPECNDEDLETFSYMLWSHLRAYHFAKDLPMTFKYPLFDRETNGPTTGYAETLSADILEEIADWYCIEVVKIEEVDGDIVVTVDFQ